MPAARRLNRNWASLGLPTEYTEEFFTRIRDATRHPEWMVRDIAVSAIASLAWPQFRSVLRDVARNDSAERVRDNAALVLASFDRVGIPEAPSPRRTAEA